jgi:hypothetical protein
VLLLEGFTVALSRMPPGAVVEGRSTVVERLRPPSSTVPREPLLLEGLTGALSRMPPGAVVEGRSTVVERLRPPSSMTPVFG